MVKPGDFVIITAWGGAILAGKVLAFDGKTITLKLRWHGVVTINTSVIREMTVFRKVEGVK
jgi:hypothetical protein